MKLIYIGNHFYMESGLRMGALYTEEGERSDWSTVEGALTAGETVEIRPATEMELAHYERVLRRIKSERGVRAAR